MFCDKEVKMFARHIERHHQNLIEVAKALSYPKKIKGKKETARPVKKKGELHVQCKDGKGSVIVNRRPTTEASTYVHCKNCHGMFKQTLLWKHNLKCPDRPEEEDRTRQKESVDNCIVC